MARTLLLLAILLTLPSCSLFRSAGTTHHGLEMIRLEGGTFRMGDIFEGDDPDATPPHTRHVASFRIAAHETTIGQYSAWAERTGRTVPPQEGPALDQQAISNVSWHEAQAFCRDAGLRLPTEPEWEYAARSGGLAQRYPGTNSEDSLDAFVRHEGNSLAHAFIVGMKEPNEVGLFDMGGNVYEWIGSFYLNYPEDGEPEWVDLEEREIRVIRGGSFRSQTEQTRTYRRAGTLADVRSVHIGFRCAEDLES